VPGVLAVQQHVERAPDGGGHPGAVAVERAELGGHRSQFPVVRDPVIGREELQPG
jgi:hypothetical protein